MFDSLTLWSLVLLILGGVLFTVLTVLLVYSVVKQRPYRFILASYIIPIVMIGFPAISSVNFKEGEIVLKKMENEMKKLEADPTKEGAVEEAEKLITALEVPPDEMTKPEVKQMVSRLETVKKLAELSRRAKSPEASPEALHEELKQLEKQPETRKMNKTGFTKTRQLVTENAVKQLRSTTQRAQTEISQQNKPSESTVKKTDALVNVIKADKNAVKKKEVSRLIGAARAIKRPLPERTSPSASAAKVNADETGSPTKRGTSDATTVRESVKVTSPEVTSP